MPETFLLIPAWLSTPQDLQDPFSRSIWPSLTHSSHSNSNMHWSPRKGLGNTWPKLTDLEFSQTYWYPCQYIVLSFMCYFLFSKISLSTTTFVTRGPFCSLLSISYLDSQLGSLVPVLLLPILDMKILILNLILLARLLLPDISDATCYPVSLVRGSALSTCLSMYLLHLPGILMLLIIEACPDLVERSGLKVLTFLLVGPSPMSMEPWFCPYTQS